MLKNHSAFLNFFVSVFTGRAQFLKNVRKYTDPEELTAEMLNDLIDKILVHAPDRSNGQRTQKIEIYYKAVGVIEIPDLDECIAAKMKQKGSKMTA